MHEEYAQLKQDVKIKEARIKELSVLILEDISGKGLKNDKTSYGTFSAVTKKSWKYSKLVEELNEDLKIKQIEEQESGVAKVKESVYLMFK